MPQAKVHITLMAALAVAACSQERQEPAPSPIAPEPAQGAAAIGYACESGRTIAVVYPDQTSARLSYDGRDYAMTSRASASGAHYAGEGLEWRTATRVGQESAVLSRESAGQQAGAVLERCSRPAPALAPGPAVTLTVPASGEIATPCTGETVSLSREGGDAGMGNRVAVLGLRNTGAAACSVVGYPELTLQGVGNRALESIRVEQNAGSYFRQGQAPTPVTLQPGAKAYFDLAWNVVPHEGAGETRCPEARTVRLTLPPDDAAVSLPQTFTPCGGYVRVSPFRPVADGSAGTSPQS